MCLVISLVKLQAVKCFVFLHLVHAYRHTLQRCADPGILGPRPQCQLQ